MAKIPTGPREWRDSITGRRSFVAGCPGMPVNFDAGGGDWQAIDLSWTQVGPVYRALQSYHKAQIGDDGQLRTSWPRNGVLRHVGFRPTRLIKFDVSDRSWTTLATANPTPIWEVVGGIICQLNVYPGVHRRLEFFNNSQSDGWVFTQQARELLAAQGPWSGYWLGTVAKMDLSLIPNVSLTDDDGMISPDMVGRLSDKGFVIRDDGVMLFRIGDAQKLVHESVGDTEIMVRSWLVVMDGNLYHVELFDPTPTASLPDGDLFHNATFGDGTQYSSNLDFEDNIIGLVASPSSNGTADSISAYMYKTRDSTLNSKCALYDYNAGSNPPYVAETAEVNQSWSLSWRTWSFASPPSIYAATTYIIALWGDESGDESQYIKSEIGTGSHTLWNQSIGYTASWPDPLGGSSLGSSDLSIYCTYTESGAGALLRYRGMDGLSNRNIGDMRG